MTDLNRRRFLQLAGGTAAMSVLSTSIARAASIPANRRTGSLRDVEHIVVLMQENRSFDHYFGTLRGVRGFGDPRPVSQPNGKPVWYQSDGTKDVLPFHPEAKNLGLQFLQDLPHDWNTGHVALNQGKYDKWVPAKGSTTMAFLRQFKGQLGGGAEVTACQDGASRQLGLVLSNEGIAPVRLTVTDAYGRTNPIEYRLQPGRQAVHTVHTQDSHGWYDVVVTSPDGYLRRLAGHLETGRPSTSDPAIG